MISEPTRDLDLAGAVNLRDLGGYDGAAGRLRWRRLLRSGGLSRLTEDSIATLRRMGLTTVIDLRHGAEHARHPNPFADRDGVVLHRISLFQGLAPSELAQGDAALPQLYREAVETRAARMVEVLERIAEAPPGIVLFHCTAGKDRTGLISAILLTLGGVDRDQIAADYALTGPRIAAHVPAMMRDAVANGMTEARLAPLFNSNPTNITGLLAYLDDRFGGVEPFLLQAGLSAGTLSKLRHDLIQPQAVAK